MDRPHVQIQTPNLLPQLRQHLARMLPGLQALPGVIGITLSGGLSRGYADHLPEIDLTLYLDVSTWAAWQCDLAPITLGITVIIEIKARIRDFDGLRSQAEQISDTPC